MKRQITLVTLSTALAITISQGNAQQQVSQTAPAKVYPSQHNPTIPTNRANAPSSTPQTSSYREHDANRLPFGSGQWWDQMNREGRARN
jgi:hypothetical protein